MIRFLLVFAVGLSSVAVAQNWPQFRGPGHRGVANNADLPEKWSATENVEWKTDLPGRGWSSPVVWGNRVFLTTVINEGKSESPKKGLYFGGERFKPPATIHRWLVMCLDLKTGKTLWKKEVHRGKPEGTIHIKNSFASETPVTDGKNVYCYFGNLGIWCFDFAGKQVWSKKIPARKTRLAWGTASSPVLHKDRLYIVNDNEQSSYLLALNKSNGDEVWKTKRDEKSNWATPFVWVNKERTEIVTPGTKKIRSYGLDGKQLWELKGTSAITIATPYEHKGLLYVTSGYVLSPLRPVYAIRPGAAGDLTMKRGERKSKWIAWSDPKAAPYNPSTLIYRDRLYVLHDRGFIQSYDSESGKPVWERQRIPRGRAFTSSPWAYRGKIFAVNKDGVTYVFNADDEFKLLHRNALADDDMCMATPAIAGDRLLIRTSARLYCIRKKK